MAVRPSLHRRALAVALVAVMVGAVPASAQDGNDGPDTADDWADIQGIAVGDFWIFEVSGSAEGTVRNDVVSKGTHTSHFGDEYEVYRVDSFTRLETEQSPSSHANDVKVPVTLDIDAQKWVRQSDHSTVEVIANVTVEEEKETKNIISYDPPLVEFVFPFAEGFKWKAEVTRYRQHGGEDPQEADFESTGRVEGREAVRVPAGTFESWRVRHDISDDQYMLRWFSEETCDLVKEEVYSRKTGELTSRSELSDYRCSHTAKENPRYQANEVRLLEGSPRTVDAETGETTEGPDIDPPSQDNDSPGLGLVAVALALAGLAMMGRRRAS